MTHSVVPEEMKEIAAHYALGALSQSEARAFEAHLAEGCEACQKELDVFLETAALLALGCGEEEPGSHVREELKIRVSADRLGALDQNGAERVYSILANEGDWMEWAEGIQFKPLYRDQASGLCTSIVRMQPGTALPPHRHTGTEQFFILEGDCYVHGQRLGPGDFHRAEAGTEHEYTNTVEGTMFLLVAPDSFHIINTPQA
jgi:quercetin dioxygenase-like cupin family protein